MLQTVGTGFAVRAGEFAVEIDVDDDLLRAVFSDLLAECARHAAGAAATDHRVAVRVGAPGSWVVEVDGERRIETGNQSYLAARVVWELNQIAQAGTHHLLLHAAAAVVESKVVVVSGAPDTGKSTLATA